MLKNGAQNGNRAGANRPRNWWGGERRRYPGRLGFNGGRHSRSGGKTGGEEGIVANQLAIKWIVPFHTAEVTRILRAAKDHHHRKQFQRTVRALLRSETGIAAHGHIRKYDGERSCRTTLSTP